MKTGNGNMQSRRINCKLQREEGASLFDTCWKQYVSMIASGAIDDRSDDDDDWINTLVSERVNNPRSKYYMHG